MLSVLGVSFLLLFVSYFHMSWGMCLYVVRLRFFQCCHTIYAASLLVCILRLLGGVQVCYYVALVLSTCLKCVGSTLVMEVCFFFFYRPLLFFLLLFVVSGFFFSS